MTIIKTIIIIILISTISLLAESNMDTSNIYGVFGGYSKNTHNASFPQLPGVPNCCKGFLNGDGTGFNLGLMYELPLPYYLHIGLRASYNQLNGNFSSSDTSLVRVDNADVPGVFHHVLNTQISDIGLEPYLVFNPFGGFRLFAGGHLGTYIQKSYNQKEELVEPANRGVFVDTKTRTRNVYSGEIPKINGVYAGFVIGASYFLPVNSSKSIFLAPEISYLSGKTNVVQGLDWNISSLRVGITLAYTPFTVVIVKPPPIEKLIENSKIDTFFVQTEDIERQKFAEGVNRTDSKKEVTDDTIFVYKSNFRTDTVYTRPKPNIKLDINVPVIYVQTQFMTEAFPILPVVFFDRNSTELEEKYIKPVEINGYSTENLKNEPLNFHYQILNIIGSRLRSYPDAKIELEGYSDSISEDGNCKIAIQRCENIAAYLKNVWSISSDRIIINRDEVNCSPKTYSLARNDSGYSENRRVEIYSKDYRIIEPINKKRFMEAKSINPAVLHFNTFGSTTKGIRGWSLTGKQGDRILFQQSGTNLPQVINDTILPEIATSLASNLPFEVEFYTFDSDGQKATAKSEIKVINDTSQIEIQRLSLILFDYASDQIPKRAKNDLKAFISEIQDSSKVTITGYSDILGTEDFNEKLSYNRANNAAKEMMKIAPNLDIIDIKGVGSMIYPPGITSFSTPPERFLSRTVFIEVFKRWR